MITVGFICFKSNAVCFSVEMLHVSNTTSVMFGVELDFDCWFGSS